LEVTSFLDYLLLVSALVYFDDVGCRMHLMMFAAVLALTSSALRKTVRLV